MCKTCSLMNKDEMKPRTIVAKANPKAPLHPASYEALIASLTYLGASFTYSVLSKALAMIFAASRGSETNSLIFLVN